MKIAVVGLGLIGGSIARDLKAQINVEVSGVDSNVHHSEKAMSLGLVHRICDLDTAISDMDVIIIATPVDVIEILLPTMLDQLSDQTIVIDVGSTKSSICAAIAVHPRRKQFVAAHPLAGTEFSGPEAAQRGLFHGAKNIICDRHRSSDRALSVALQIFESIGMQSDFMSPEEHDRHLAYVSHLSHVTSFSLGLTVLDIEKDEKQIFNLASTGFRSTSRLAKSNPQTWAAIFGKNKKYVGEALDRYMDTLSRFRSAIEEDDRSEMVRLMTEANDLRRVLNPVAGKE